MKQTIKLSLLSVVCLPLMIANYAIAEKTNNPSSYDDRRLVFGEDDKLRQAISLLSQQVRNEPTNAWAIYNLALAYRVKGDFDKSVALFNDYIRLNQTNDMAFKFRAQIYNITGKYDEAIKDFNEGLRLKPNDANALATYGSTLVALGRITGREHDPGTAHLRGFMELRPDHGVREKR